MSMSASGRTRAPACAVGVLLAAAVLVMATACGSGGSFDPSVLGEVFTSSPGAEPVSAPAAITGNFELRTDYHDKVGNDELTETSSWRVDVRLRTSSTSPQTSYTDDGSNWTFEGHFSDVQKEPCVVTVSESRYDASGDFKDSTESHRYITGRTSVHGDNSLYLILEALVQDIPGDGTEGGFCDEPPESVQPTTGASFTCELDRSENGTFVITSACLEGASGAEWSTVTGQLEGR